MALACNKLDFPVPCLVLQATSGLRSHLIHVLVAGLCLNLGACGLGGAEFDPIKRSDAPAPSTVQSAVVAEFHNAKLTGNPQVSDLQQTSGPQPGDWMLCFKSDGTDQAVRYAVFFRNDKPVIARPAAIIDGCHRAAYHPLEPPLPHWPPG